MKFVMRRWNLSLLLCGLVACQSDRPGVDVTTLNGWLIADPVPKPDFTLSDTSGDAFSFVNDTEGFVTLLFFGFTNCPDICPVHLANVGAVLQKLPPPIASQVRVVFVTTDPERDTPEVLRNWLNNFSSDFVGLTGPLDEVNAVQQAIGLPSARRETRPDGGYGMAHSAQILAFTTDNLAHVSYAFGTRQTDWAQDLPRLVQEGPPKE